MVGTIGPVVHGRRRSNTNVWILWYIGGHLVGASFVGFFVSCLGYTVLPRGWPDGGFAVPVLAAAAVGAALRELEIVRYPLPSTGWQVPRHWSLLRVEVMARRYGVCLGTALSTKVLHATLYIALMACFFLAEPIFGALAMAFYGLARAVVVLTIVFRASSLDELHATNFSIANRWQVVKVVNGIFLTAFAAHLTSMIAHQ